MTIEQQHTPEPWQAIEAGAANGDRGVSIMGLEPQGVVARMAQGYSLDEQWATARRIAASMNACVDYTTDELEESALNGGLQVFLRTLMREAIAGDEAKADQVRS